VSRLIIEMAHDGSLGNELVVRATSGDITELTGALSPDPRRTARQNRHPEDHHSQQRVKGQNDTQARNALPLGGFRPSGTLGSGIVGRPTVGALLAGAANPTATAGREEHHRACEDCANCRSST
jgi:hypothetical protein